MKFANKLQKINISVFHILAHKWKQRIPVTRKYNFFDLNHLKNSVVLLVPGISINIHIS